ncbi:MAG: CopL family metal-binding regulatory protein [Dokdonella sp.]
MSIVSLLVRIVLSLCLILAGSGVAGAGGHGAMQHPGQAQVAVSIDTPCHAVSMHTSATKHDDSVMTDAPDEECATAQTATDCCQSGYCSCACQSPPAPGFLASTIKTGLSINAMPLLVARADAPTERALAPLNRPPIR